MIQQRERLLDLSEEMIQSIIDEHCPPNSHAEDWDLEVLGTAVKQRFNFDPAIDAQGGLERETLAESLWAEVEKVIEARETEYPLSVLLHYARLFYLEEIDERWIEHLKSMEALREGIHLRGYGQKDPKQEYKKEGFVIFGEMMDNIGRNVCEKLFHMQLQRADAPAARGRRGAPSSKPPTSVPMTAARPPGAQDDRVGWRRRAPGPRREDRTAAATAPRPRPSRSGATSPRWAATIRAPAEAGKNTKNATATSPRRSRLRARGAGRRGCGLPGGRRRRRLSADAPGDAGGDAAHAAAGRAARSGRRRILPAGERRDQRPLGGAERRRRAQRRSRPMPLPPGVTSAYFAVAGVATPGDTVLVGYLGTDAASGSGGLAVIAFPADGSPPAAPASTVVTFPGGIPAASSVAMISSRKGMNAGLAWVDDASGQVMVATRQRARGRRPALRSPPPPLRGPPSPVSGSPPARTI